MLDSSKKKFIPRSINNEEDNWILHAVVLHVMNSNFFINSDLDVVSGRSSFKSKFNLLNVFLYINNNGKKITDYRFLN